MEAACRIREGIGSTMLGLLLCLRSDEGRMEMSVGWTPKTRARVGR